jgi:hypothetical protein
LHAQVVERIEHGVRWLVDHDVSRWTPGDSDAFLASTAPFGVAVVHTCPVRDCAEQVRLGVARRRPRTVGVAYEIGERVRHDVSGGRSRDEHGRVADEFVGVALVRLLGRHLVHTPTLPPARHPGDRRHPGVTDAEET